MIDSVNSTSKEKNYHKQVYNSSLWKRLRKNKLLDQPVCAVPGCNSISSEVDHILTFTSSSDPLAYNYFNLHCLCYTHHRRITALERTLQKILKTKYNNDVLDTPEMNEQASQDKIQLFLKYDRPSFDVNGFPIQH